MFDISTYRSEEIAKDKYINETIYKLKHNKIVDRNKCYYDIISILRNKKYYHFYRQKDVYDLVITNPHNLFTDRQLRVIKKECPKSLKCCNNVLCNGECGSLYCNRYDLEYLIDNMSDKCTRNFNFQIANKILESKDYTLYHKAMLLDSIKKNSNIFTIRQLRILNRLS